MAAQSQRNNQAPKPCEQRAWLSIHHLPMEITHYGLLPIFLSTIAPNQRHSRGDRPRPKPSVGGVVMTHPEVTEVRQGEPIGFVPVYAPEKPAAPAPVAAPIPGKALALLGVALVFGGLGAYFVATSADRAQLAAERNRADLAEQRATIAEQEVNRVRACVLGGAQ